MVRDAAENSSRKESMSPPRSLHVWMRLTMTKFDCQFWLPVPRTRVFPFFADPMNLVAITPERLQFRVLTPGPIEMRQGARMEYEFRLWGLRLGWASEITAWEPMTRFVDEQRRGPYKVWIHEHLFEDRDGGTLITDKVIYATAGGRLVERWIVGKELRRIFEHRERRLREILGGTPTA